MTSGMPFVINAAWPTARPSPPLADDELAIAAENRRLQRNFMGYTTRLATDLVGVGVSAIGDVRGAYAQNHKKLPAYYAAVIAHLEREGVRNLMVVPLSFVSDHIETLYEVDQLFAETARRAGMTGYYRPAALNTDARFIQALASLTRCHLFPAIDRRPCATGALA
jgi:hypothetical protein